MKCNRHTKKMCLFEDLNYVIVCCFFSQVHSRARVSMHVCVCMLEGSGHDWQGEQQTVRQ